MPLTQIIVLRTLLSSRAIASLGLLLDTERRIVLQQAEDRTALTAKAAVQAFCADSVITPDDL